MLISINKQTKKKVSLDRKLVVDFKEGGTMMSLCFF